MPAIRLTPIFSVLLLLLAYVFLAEVRPLLNLAFSPVIELGELGSGERVFFKPVHPAEAGVPGQGKVARYTR